MLRPNTDQVFAGIPCENEDSLDLPVLRVALPERRQWKEA